jgi:peptidoglycan/LPS O-acetylase OafA/YrhL
VHALRDDLRAPARWPALDGVRGVAVIAVVLYHAVRLLVIGESSEPAGAFTAAWWPVMTGRLALDAFFVLSGFLIVESWQATRARHEGLWSAARVYVKRRAARILPAYYVSLVILVPLLAPHLLRSPTDLALLAGVQQYLRPGLPSEVNIVYWSLTTEVHFYVLAPLVGIALRYLGARRTVVLCLALAVAWQAATPFGLPQSLVVGRIDQFALGAAIAPIVAAWERGEPSRLVEFVKRRGAGAALAGLLLAGGMWQGAILDGSATGLSALMHPFVGVVMAALLLRLLVADAPTFLENPTLRLSGLLSYGVYLFHYPVLEHGFEWMGLRAGDGVPFVLGVSATLAFTAVSLAIGGASYVLIERPFLRRKVKTAPEHPRVPEPATRTLAPWPMTPATSTTSSVNSV